MNSRNYHTWETIFNSDLCQFCLQKCASGTAKAGHAAAHVRRGRLVRYGSGTREDPYCYITPSTYQVH